MNIQAALDWRYAAQTEIGDVTVDRYVDQFMEVRRVPYDDIAGYVEHMKKALAGKASREKREWAHRQVYIALGTLLPCSELTVVR